MDSYDAGVYSTNAGTVLANGTVIFAGYASSLNALASWCCLPSYSSSLARSYAPSIPAITVPAPFSYTRDIVHDTRSEGLFASNVGTGIQYLTLNPVSSTVIFSFGWSSGICMSMVDFIHCSGPIYGILAGFQLIRKMSFLPLTPAAPGVPPVVGAPIDVAGDGINGNVDGVGSDARFSIPLYIAAAHTAPAWIVADMGTKSIRLAVFTNDFPLRLNVTTLIATPGQEPNGVVTTSDDLILYAAICNLQQIQLVLNPLSSSPTLGPVLAIVAMYMYKISLHPGCESLLLVGCQGEYLLVYNITSQSTIQSIHALDSYSPGTGLNYTLAGTVIANGTVIFGGYSDSTHGLASWCCLPPFSIEKRVTFTPSTAAIPLKVTSKYGRDIIYDTRSDGLFLSSYSGIQFLTLDPVSSTTFFSNTDYKSIAMVDFIHCSGPIYGILMAFVVSHRISFVPLTPAASGTPPVSGTLISVAGDGTDGSVDGVGSAARFKDIGFVAAAHTAPVWIVGGCGRESILLAMFTNDVPLSLNVTTLIATPGSRPVGVVTAHDDSILYGADYNSLSVGHIITVLNPLSANLTLGPVLSIVAAELGKLTFHPGCESLMLVGCKGDYLLVYNITSQSTIQSIRAAGTGFQLVEAGAITTNGTVIFFRYASTLIPLTSWCCLPPYNNSAMKATYAPSVAAAPLAVPAKTRDIIHDTRTGGLFAFHDDDGIRYLTLNPLSSTSIFPYALNGLFLAMVDFIHCSGPVYGLLIGYQVCYKISFLPLTAGVPPVSSTGTFVAGDTSGNVDGVGSAARFKEMGFIAAAHTAPVWMVGGWHTESVRRVVFTNDVPLRLNVTTLIATPGKQVFGVVMTNDDSILYASAYDSQQIVVVLNPLSTSSSPTLGPVLSIVANSVHKITLHPGCETILLVGCVGDALLIYNVTSQSTIRTVTAVKSSPWTLAGNFLTNGTVLFGTHSTDPGAFASWCCLSPYSDSKRSTYTPSVDALSLSVPSKTLRDIIHDTRSGSLFTANDATGIQYLTLSPLSSTVVYSYTGTLFIAMVDFLHCSGSVYGIIVSQQSGRKMSFLPLTPGAPPTAGTFIDVAGDGTDGEC